MGSKLISLVLVACLVLLPVQIYAYGGGGGSDGDGAGEAYTSSTDIGVGGPPMTFTPPDDLDYGIPESSTNPGVAGSTITFTDSDVAGTLKKKSDGHTYGSLESVGKGVVIAGKVAIVGITFVGGVAGILALTPATAATAGTIGALGVIAKVCGGTALVLGATMQGAETYGKSLDKGKSQEEAAEDGLNSAAGKGFIDHAINLNPAFGTIDLIQKAGTGKGFGDMTHEGTTGGTPDIGPTSMTPIDA